MLPIAHGEQPMACEGSGWPKAAEGPLTTSSPSARPGRRPRWVCATGFSGSMSTPGEHQPLSAGAMWADTPPEPLATPARHITTLTLGMTILLLIEKSHASAGGSDVANGGFALESISRSVPTIHVPCKGYVKPLKSLAHPKSRPNASRVTPTLSLLRHNHRFFRQPPSLASISYTQYTMETLVLTQEAVFSESGPRRPVLAQSNRCNHPRGPQSQRSRVKHGWSVCL